MAGDFNLFFDSKLDAKGGNPTLKKKSLAELLEFKETYELYEIWVRNTKSKQFTFKKKHSLGFIQRRLDYTLISNTLQEFVTMTKILTYDYTDNFLLPIPVSDWFIWYFIKKRNENDKNNFSDEKQQQKCQEKYM